MSVLHFDARTVTDEQRSHAADLCEKLGLDANDVLELHIRDGVVIAVVMERNALGKGYLGPDDRVATTSQTFEMPA